jgi:hypothetical protein
MAAEGAERGRRFKGDMPPVLESSLSAITRVCRSRVQLRASVILEDRGGEGRGPGNRYRSTTHVGGIFV